MRLPLFIARRYLFARKSHNVINIISAISAAGMALGTAALVIILSVYNGFDSLISSSISDLDPDVQISPARGKVWTPDAAWLDALAGRSGVVSVSEVLQDDVFLDYGGRQGVAVARGVDGVWEAASPVATHTMHGEFKLHDGGQALCATGVTLAYSLGINPAFLTRLTLYYPRRDVPVQMTAPAASLSSVSLRPSALFSISADADASLVILPLEEMRSLLGYTDECSAVELRTDPSLGQRGLRSFIKGLRAELGGDFRVRDRVEQNEALFKMMRYEKAAIFLILLFVVIIVAFNIFGSLTMLMIEKREDIATLRSMGAGTPLIRRIFVLEGWMVSLLGLAVGLAAGLGLAWLQQTAGLIKMPGSFVAAAYPVVVRRGDVLAVAAGVALVGYLIALIPAQKIKT